tara:strand:- start:494 stop:1333 length:840 start_codon:yes stop_codon:yes gene_type:complete
MISHQNRFTCCSQPLGSNKQLFVGVIGRSILMSAWNREILLDTQDHDGLKYYRVRKMYLGIWNEMDCEVWELEHQIDCGNDYSLIDLRSLLLSLQEPLFSVACRAVQLLEWVDGHKFCGHCGNPNAQSESENALSCVACSVDNYPRISPCIIVVVTLKDRCLLARQKNWETGMYSALAGFLEAGESAEEAIHREVLEEVDVRVKNLRYIGSQSWPFPGQLMLGFLAEAESQKFRVDGAEISEAQWWRYDDMPPITPPPTVMSGMLIEHFIQEARKLHSA